MKKNLLSILALGAAAVLIATAPLQAQTASPTPTPPPTLFGVTFFGNQLVNVDPATGVAKLIGSLGQVVNGYGIAARNNQLYTFDPNLNKIREISRVSGRILRDISIGTSGLVGEGDLAFRPSDGMGFLTSALNGNSPSFTPVNDIYTFNIDTGTSVRIGTTGVAINGLAFDSSNTLYGIGKGDGTLYTISQVNGAATPVGSLGVSNNSPIGAIAFGPNGVLYASIDDRLYTINKSTGAATPASQTVLDFDFSSVSGLVFAQGAASIGNMSARVAVGAGDNVGIGGFIVKGTPGKKLLLRGIGPSLTTVPGTLSDPVLELFSSQGMSLVRNDNWRDSAQASAIAATGIAPPNDKESAILQTLNEGLYTFVLSGASGATGIGLGEIYDLDLGSGSRLANISNRGFVQTGDKILIGGIIISGSAPQRVVVRAIGPDLSASRVPTPLQDPFLRIFDANGNGFGQNDNYVDAGQTTELTANGLTPGYSRDSAIITDFSPGLYTALVTGVSGTGNALIEFYNLSNNNQ